MKYELIFCDFDGTLLRNDFTVGEKSVKAIKDYISRGGNFVVCTGRMSRSMDGWLDYLGIGKQRIAVAGFQGTHIADTSGNLLYCNYISPDSVYKIMELGKRLGVYTHFYDPDWVYVEEENEINREYRRITSVPLKVVGDLCKYIKSHPDLKVVKAMAVAPADKLDEVRAKYEKLVINDVQFQYSSDNFIDFVSKNGGKGEALRKVAAFLNVPIEKTIAMGDHQNDVSMLKAAGLGIAVANAREEVKKAADYVTVSNDEDAAAEIINKFCGE